MITLNDLKVLTASIWSFLLCLILAVTFYVHVNFEQPETPPQLQVMDKPLLTPEQRKTVLRTDSVAFDVGNEHIVITHGARAALEGYY